MRIVGVHGVGKQHLGRHQLLALWAPALADGLERTLGHPVAAPEPDLAFYGDLFLRAKTAGAKGVSDVDALDDLSAADAAELEAGLVEALGADAVDDERTKGTRTPLPVQAVIRVLDRRFGAGAGLLHVGVFRQVKRYLGTPAVKAAVDARVEQVVGPDTRILIGHSLGSVVAYEYVRRHPDHTLDLLITLGSPLGLRMVRDRLVVTDLAVPAWDDVRDPRDPVACAGGLGTRWPQTTDRMVDNGSDAHAAERYLSAEETGTALLAVLPDLDR